MQVNEVTRDSMVVRTIAVGIVAAVALVAVAGVFSEGEATGHVRLHGIMALMALVIGGAVVVRWPTAGWASRAPAIGFALFAFPQLIEAVGAFGYAADNNIRSDLAIVHDVGVVAGGVGLVAVVVGLSIGGLAASSRLQGGLRWVGGAAVITGLGGGILLVKTMIGF